MADNKQDSIVFGDVPVKELEKKYRSELKNGNAETRLNALINLGSLYCESKKYDEAESYLLKALTLALGRKNNSKLSLIYKTLGTIYLKQFKIDKAEENFSKALTLTPEKNRRVVSFLCDSLGDVFTKSSRTKEGLSYYEKALDIRKELELWKGISETLNKIGVNYYYQSDYDNAIKFVTESLHIREERKEKKEAVASCLNNLCLAYLHKGNYPEALENGIRALRLFEEAGNIESQGLIYNNLGLIYFEMSLFSEALECQFKALKIKEQNSNKAILANTLNNISMIFSRLFNLEKALEYAQKALLLRKEINDSRGISSSYNELGRIFDKMNDFEKAIEYFSESIKMKRELNIQSGLGQSLENLGMIYLKQKKYEESGKCLIEAKRIYEELGEQKAVTGIYRNISSLFIQVGKYEEALVYIKRSHDLSKSLNLKDKLRDSYKLLSEIYGKRNNFRKALAYYVMYSKTNEELLNFQKQQELGNISARYENDKKDKENEIYKLKNIELVRINKELKRSKSELQRSNSAKDKFFNIVAHDLKNPFSILYTTSELLSTYFDELTVKKQREYINTINLSTKHLLKLLENLLEWSRSQSGLRQFNPERFNFNEILASCVELSKPNADLKNISLEVYADPKIFIFADKNMIKTVIRNFLANAIKFTKNGGKISAAGEVKEGKFIFKVTDNGVGIRKKDLPKLFVIDRHFTTIGTANEKGTGIGLLLCREFIEKHKGKVFVESIYRKGSVFGFEIPV